MSEPPYTYKRKDMHSIITYACLELFSNNNCIDQDYYLFLFE